MPTTDAPAPTMAERIAAAERALTPLDLALNALETAKANAVERGDFAAAQKAQEALPAAREEAAAARALVDSLRSASDEIRRQQDIEARELQLAERTATARQNVDRYRQTENDQIAEARHHMERARDLAREARSAVLAALEAERAAGLARQEIEGAMALIENRPGHHVARPNHVAVQTEQDQLIIALMRAGH